MEPEIYRPVHVCMICQSHTNFQSMVKLYEPRYEELHMNKILNHEENISYVHLVCAAFFPETEVAITNKTPNLALMNTGDVNQAVETIVCNYHDSRMRYKDRFPACCMRTDYELLAPCIAM
jgi:hypothetical protein